MLCLPFPCSFVSKVAGFIHVMCGRTMQFSASGVLCQEEYDIPVYDSLLFSPRSSWNNSYTLVDTVHVLALFSLVCSSVLLPNILRTVTFTCLRLKLLFFRLLVCISLIDLGWIVEDLQCQACAPSCVWAPFQNIVCLYVCWSLPSHQACLSLNWWVVNISSYIEKLLVITVCTEIRVYHRETHESRTNKL